MKIILAGGGTGGHIIPLFAVADAIVKESNRQNLIAPKLYFFSDTKYNEKMLFDRNIDYIHIPAGKLRTYFAVQNFTDMFVTVWGCIVATVRLFMIYPDAVFAKGGYASFPTLLAARILGIPIILHESDTVPGRVSSWAGKFATRVAITFVDAAKYFKNNNVALTGQPIMDQILPPENFMRSLPDKRPIILITGGSQGAKAINDLVLSALPELIQNYNIIHQCGDANMEEVVLRSQHILQGNPLESNYAVYGHMDFKDVYPNIDVAVARSGATTVCELAAWQIPSIFIPLPIAHANHQALNAYNAKSAGWAKVIEESNLSTAILISEINEIIHDAKLYNDMSESAKNYNNRTASITIAKEIISIAISHYAKS